MDSTNHTTGSSNHSTASSNHSTASSNRSTGSSNHSTGSSNRSTGSRNRASDRNSIVCPSNTEHAASHLTRVKLLDYNTAVNPNTKHPRDVDKVWSDLVCLFDPSKKQSTVVCPESLKNVMKAEHEDEREFNKLLFNELRKGLGEQGLIDACKNPDESHKEPIVFTNGKFGGFAVGIRREANGERQDENNEASPSATNESAQQANATSNDSRDSESGVVAKATLDHGACLLREEKKANWKVEHCLSAIELKLTGPNNQCQAFQNGVTGETYSDWVDLGYNHGAIAQVMLYIMAWVVPSLAMLGLLDQEVPWAVIVCKRKPGKRKSKSKPSNQLQSETPQVIADTTSPDEKPNEKIANHPTATEGKQPPPNKVHSQTTSLQGRGESKVLQKKGNSAGGKETESGHPDESLVNPTPKEQNTGKPPLPVNKNVKEPETAFNHWVTGKIYAPPGCGSNYEYAVTGFERLLATATVDESSYRALSAYLDTIYVGLVAAKTWLDKLRSSGLPLKPVPTSGKGVMIGDQVLTESLTLRGRAGRFPIVDSNAHAAAAAGGGHYDQAQGWTINQGEIFTGKLNICQLTQNSNLDIFDYFPFSNNDAEVAVAVKVSSMAVHKYLTHPRDAFSALDRIHRSLMEANQRQAAIEKANHSINKAENGIVEATRTIDEASKSIDEASQAIDETNQSIEFFHSLAPQYDGVAPARWTEQVNRHKSALAKGYADRTKWQSEHAKGLKDREKWRLELAKGKSDLTEAKNMLAKSMLKAPEISDVLLAVHKTPIGLITIMADLSVQHYKTLRPEDCRSSLSALWIGFLELVEKVLIPMANLDVIHPDLRPGNDETANVLYKKDGQGENEKVEMKLIDFESLVVASEWKAPRKKLKSLYIKRQANARVFLWWQCVAIAYAWKHKKTQTQMVGIQLKNIVDQYLRGEAGNPWLKAFCSGGSKQMTEALLPKLWNLFSGQESPP